MLGSTYRNMVAPLRLKMLDVVKGSHRTFPMSYCAKVTKCVTFVGYESSESSGTPRFLPMNGLLLPCECRILSFVSITLLAFFYSFLNSLLLQFPWPGLFVQRYLSVAGSDCPATSSSALPTNPDHLAISSSAVPARPNCLAARM